MVTLGKGGCARARRRDSAERPRTGRAGGESLRARGRRSLAADAASLVRARMGGLLVEHDVELVLAACDTVIARGAPGGTRRSGRRRGLPRASWGGRLRGLVGPRNPPPPATQCGLGLRSIGRQQPSGRKGNRSATPPRPILPPAQPGLSAGTGPPPTAVSDTACPRRVSPPRAMSSEDTLGPG
jgi:hypothetical protein